MPNPKAGSLAGSTGCCRTEPPVHPAFSIILFTTLSGAGYGLLTGLALRAPIDDMLTSPVFGIISLGLAAVLIGGGLMASTLHLKHPERAWRALSQWRSSWLSREGIAAIVTFVPFAAFAWGWVIEGEIWPIAGYLSAFGALVTLACTSMIYHSLITVPQWRHRRVPLVFILMAWATGLPILTAIVAAFGLLDGRAAMITAAAIAFAWFFKLLYWRDVDGMKTGSTGFATGLGGGDTGRTVRPLFPPHTQGNYLLSEMGFRVGRKHARKLRRIAVTLGAIVPILLLVPAVYAPALPAAILSGCGALSALTGTFVERWLFFAEATHVVKNFYEGERPAEDA